MHVQEDKLQGADSHAGLECGGGEGDAQPPAARAVPARAARRRAQAAGRARARAARGAQPHGRAGAAVRPQGIADTRIVHPHMYAQEFVMRASNTLKTLK